jgi:arylsulfatase A-like enzyme
MGEVFAAEDPRAALRIAAGRAMLAGFVGVCGFACGSGDDGSKSPGERPPNLLFVVVDTLRADHVGANGYEKATTPTIDRIGREGAVFTQAIAQSSWTRPSMASLLSGLYPTTTGLTCHNFRVPRSDCDLLSPQVVTIAEELRDEYGYRTAGITANINLDPIFGFDQGYDHYVSIAEEISGSEQGEWRLGNDWLRESTELVTEEALAWLEEPRSDSPFLLYLHYLDPHAPYEPPEATAGTFPPDSYAAVPRTSVLLALYDEEILFVDRELQRVLDALQASQELERTAIVIVSDHGEEFHDHGSTKHGWTMFDEQLRVPLVLSIPGVTTPGTVIDEQVRLLDVVPTLIEGLGLAGTLPERLQGTSLLPLLAGGTLPMLPALSEHGYNPLTSYRSPPWKLILDEAGPVQLYHLGDDPGESINLAEQRVEVVTRLSGELAALRATASAAAERYSSAGGEVQLSEEQIRNLEAIGYTGGD